MNRHVRQSTGGWTDPYVIGSMRRPMSEPSSPPSIFITAEPGSPAPGWIAGGLTVLERRVREAKRAGAARILVACTTPLAPELEALVERVPPGSTPPAGARVVRADELAEVKLDSPRALRRAEWNHMQGMQKSFQGITDAWLNHHVSLRITRVLARTRVTPNQISVLTIFVGIAAVLAVALGGRDGVIWGACLLQAHSILDSCDGELARLRFQYSKLGQWLDNLSDDVVDNLFPVAVGYALGGIWLAIALAAAAARIVVTIAIYLSVYRRTRTGDVFAFRCGSSATKRRPTRCSIRDRR
jgi:phosphatidylglycerophosphate synthase